MTIPDGVYGAIGNTLNVTATSPDSAEKLRTLISVLQRANQPTVEDVEKAVSRYAPEVGSLVESLKTNEKKDAQKLIQTICAVLTLILTALPYLSGLTNPSQADSKNALDRAIADMHGERSTSTRNHHETQAAKHKTKQKPNPE